MNEKQLIEAFEKWEKENCHPECTNPDCHKPNRGGGCGKCTQYLDNKRV